MSHCSICRGTHVRGSHRPKPVFYWHVLLQTENVYGDRSGWILQDIFETRQEAAKYAARLSADPYYHVRIVRKRKLGPQQMGRSR